MSYKSLCLKKVRIMMLVLAPYADYSAETAAKRITRAQCLDLNKYAADMANVTIKRDEERERAPH